MHNVEVWGSGVCPLMMCRRTASKGAEVEEVLVGDIMALCIMSKCGGGGGRVRGRGRVVWGGTLWLYA